MGLFYSNPSNLKDKIKTEKTVHEHKIESLKRDIEGFKKQIQSLKDHYVKMILHGG